MIFLSCCIFDRLQLIEIITFIEETMSGTSLYEVEKIIGKKIINGKPRYRVKWEGYSVGESTWEVASHLRHVKEMVEEFEKKLALQEESEKVKDLSTSGVFEEEEEKIGDDQVNHGQIAKRSRPKKKSPSMNIHGRNFAM